MWQICAVQIFITRGEDSSGPYTLEQVGLIFGVTRERVRQIEAKAFDKLQDPRRRSRLVGFLSQSQLTGLAP